MDIQSDFYDIIARHYHLARHKAQGAVTEGRVPHGQTKCVQNFVWLAPLFERMPRTSQLAADTISINLCDNKTHDKNEDEN